MENKQQQPQQDNVNASELILSTLTFAVGVAIAASLTKAIASNIINSFK